MSRLRDGAALAVCLAVVAAIALVTGDRAESVPVQYEDVAVGEVGVASEFDAQVTGVHLTQQVQRDEYGEPLATDVRFVVVDVSADARTDAVGFQNVWLLTISGDRYAPRPEFSTAQPPLTAPGFTVTGAWVFQVPVDRVAGARLLLGPDVPLFITYDITVRVDLGLTDDTPLATEPVIMEPATTEVTP